MKGLKLGLSLTGASGNGLAATTAFLTRFTASPPLDEATGNAGTLAGNATVDTANSRITLDGVGDWVTFPASSVYNLGGDFTLEVHTDQAAAQAGSIAGHIASGAGRWTLFCDGSGKVFFYADNIQPGAIVTSLGAGGILNGSEHHIAVVRESNTWRIYFDGVQKDTVSLAGSIGSASGVLYVGTDPFDTTGRDVAGHYGRVKISNTCLYPGGTTFTAPARTDP